MTRRRPEPAEIIAMSTGRCTRFFLKTFQRKQDERLRGNHSCGKFAGAICPCWPGLLLNGNLLARFQRAVVLRIAVTPGIASLNPGLMSAQPFRAAGLHEA